MKKQILRVFLTLFAVSLILGGALTVVLAEEEPTVSIEYFALSFDNEVHIEYAVECQGFTPTGSNTGMLFWTAEPGKPEMNTEKSRAATSGTTVIDGKEHIVFRYTDLAAKQMCDEIWARAYAVVDGKVYYSNVEKYSIVTYAAHKLGLTDGVEGTKDETLKTMLREMLEYGEAAQKHFGYNLEHLPTDILPGNSFTVTFDSDGGSAVPAQTVYRGRRAQEPTAPEKAGYTFAGWYNGDAAWTFGTDPVTADITLTAKWTPKTVTSSEGLVFTSNGDGTCTVTRLYNHIVTDLVIPETSPEGERVTAIGKDAFWLHGQLESITIPSSVESIGSTAFAGCDNLKRVNVSDISAWCRINFEYASNPLAYADNLYLNGELITELLIPDGVTNIAKYAFSGCTGLTNIIIPNSVQSIGEGAFSGCVGLRSITIPFVGEARENTKNVTLRYMFIGGLTSDGYGDGGIPSALKTVIVTSGTNIGESAFSGCAGLTNIILPNSLVSIGASAFSGCANLTSLTIPENVRRIGNEAFVHCFKLFEIYNKSGVTIDFGYYGNAAKAIYTTEYTSKFDLDDNGYLLYPDGNDRILVSYFGDETELILPIGITEINQGAFYGCRSLTGITIPESVTAIGQYAFYNCESLTHIEIPKAVTVIQYNTFSGCKSLTEIVIPKKVNWIGSSAFEWCTSLTSIVIPDSVTEIGYCVFEACTSLTSITLPFIGRTADLNASLSYLFGSDSNVPASLKTVVITGSTKIGSNAFVCCPGLKNLTIAATVTGIGDYAFDGCSDLTITFNGTRAQWDALEKSENWATGCNGLTVRCSDDPQQTA